MVHLKTKVGRYLVSTTITRDHGLETMIFDDEVDMSSDLYVQHYSTEEEARSGHDVAVEKAKQWLADGYPPGKAMD